MSRPRSRSPRYRRFPWEEPNFDPQKVIEELNGNPRDRGRRLRGGSEDFREESYPEGLRRSPFPDDPRFRHQRHSDREEFYHWGASPHHDGMHSENRRFSPPKEVDFDVKGNRGDFQRSDDRGVRPPPLLPGLASLRRSSTDRQQRKAGTDWSREEQGRFRDFSPGMRSGDKRAENLEKGGRFPQHPNRGRQRENQRYDKAPAFKRSRQETDAVHHPGFWDEEGFVDGSYSDRPRGGFRGRSRGSFPRGNSRPFIAEYNHGAAGGMSVPQFDYNPNLDRQRSSRSAGSSQEHFRTSTSRPREDAKGEPVQDNSRDSSYQESRRSPSNVTYGNQGGPSNYGRRGREGYNQGVRGLTGPHRNQPPHQDLPQGEQRRGYPPFRDEYKFPAEQEPSLEDEQRLQHRRRGCSRSPEPSRPREASNSNRSPPKSGWSAPQSEDVTVQMEETLTIKVDMSRPAHSYNSVLCYSSDRQLSQDLVNVGRQRLDFLPQLEHSGTHEETSTHTSTFAQEIITLVHFVKDQYFGGDGFTLHERFSAPQKGGHADGELEELTLNQRFTSNRGFDLNMDSLLDDEEEEALFFRLGSMQDVKQQPPRGPGDLRHDLERRRQEKLEAVKVTIPGSSLSQRSQGGLDQTAPMDHQEFSSWTGELIRRREGSAVRLRGSPAGSRQDVPPQGSRRGAYNRPGTGPQRRNSQLANQRQNLHSDTAGPNW